MKLDEVLKTYQRTLVGLLDERMGAASDAAAEAARRAVADALADLGPTDRRPNDRLADRVDAVGRAVTRLAEEQGKLAEALGERTGHGIVAVARVIRQDLERLRTDLAEVGRRMDALEASVRSLHRTVAWEGLRTPRRTESPPG